MVIFFELIFPTVSDTDQTLSQTIFYKIQKQQPTTLYQHELRFLSDSQLYS